MDIEFNLRVVECDAELYFDKTQWFTATLVSGDGKKVTASAKTRAVAASNALVLMSEVVRREMK